MTQFQIKKGYKRYLLDENTNKPLIDLEEGCWYLTLDTMEVYVCVKGELKPLQQAGLNLEEYDDKFEDIEKRLAQLEQKHELIFAEYNQFPSHGEAGMLYIALDKNATYIFANEEYICVGNTEGSHYDVINGGSAKD